MIKTALIGFGMSGKTIHFPLIHAHDGFTLKTVVSRSEDTASYLEAHGSNATLTKNYEDVLADDTIDLVVLCVPNELHADFTEKAIRSGKHITIEKPFVKTYKEAKALFDLAKEKDVVLRVFHNRRFDGDFMTVKDILKHDSLGEILSLSARFDRFRVNPKAGWRTQEGLMSGVFFDLGPHLFHYTVSLFGRPKKVTCDLITDHKDLSTDDHFEATLHYDTLRVYLGAEQFARRPLPKFHIKGLKASYIKEGFDHPEFVYTPPNNPYQEGLVSYTLDNTLNKRDVQVRQSAHYQWYTVLEEDINNTRLETEESSIALEVIRTMEEALESHHKRNLISS